METAHVVALTVGVLAALATVMAAVVGARKASRDRRDNIRRDIDLAQSLAVGSQARKNMEALVNGQVNELCTEPVVRAHRTMFLLSGGVGQACLTTLLVILVAEGDDPKHALQTGALISFGFMLAAGFVLDAKRTRVRRTLRGEDPDPDWRDYLPSPAAWLLERITGQQR